MYRIFFLFVLMLFWERVSFSGSINSKGVVSVEMIYKESYEVTNLKVDGEELTPTTILVNGRPNSELNIDWSDKTVVSDALTGQQFTVNFEKPESSHFVIGKDAKLNVEIKPKEIDSTDKKSDFKGQYGVYITY